MKLESGLIFPFSYMGETLLGELLRHWERLLIGLPYGLNPEEYLLLHMDSGRIGILRPPKEFIPPDSFQRLLKEYKAWMSTNYDKGFMGFLKYAAESLNEEDAIYHIRGSIRKDSNTEREALNWGLKWHLILHLFHESLKEIHETQELLEGARLTDPILKEAIFEDDQVEHILRDLSDMDLKEYIPSERLKEALDAWFGLFGAHIKEQESLLTWEEEVVDLLLGNEELKGEKVSEGLFCYSLSPDFEANLPNSALLKGKKIYLVKVQHRRS